LLVEDPGVVASPHSCISTQLFDPRLDHFYSKDNTMKMVSSRVSLREGIRRVVNKVKSRNLLARKYSY
jgi:hypothetical protein